VSQAARLAAIALGSNLGDRAGLINEAARRLTLLGRLQALSRLYETPPWGPPQPAYLNAVALLETSLDGPALMDALLEAERALGRVRGERWGPRTIDLDLICLGSEQCDSPGLTLPHPEAHRRAFVLVPLAEVAPELTLPGHGVVSALLRALPADEVAAVKPFDENRRT